MITLTRYGRREWLSALLVVISLICIFVLLMMFELMPIPFGLTLASLSFLAWLALAGFFRDPDRKIPDLPDAILSPADGVVRDIELIKNESADCQELKELFQGRDMLRIGIFLSVFNVHLNRAPADMKSVFRTYKPGKFHDARDGRASKENESMLLGAEATAEDVVFPIAVRQVSGAIARRIVCPVEKGDVFRKGQRYGMIKFGSRTELYLPAGAGFEIAVKVGQKVTAGISVLATVLPSAKDKLQQG